MDSRSIELPTTVDGLKELMKQQERAKQSAPAENTILSAFPTTPEEELMEIEARAKQTIDLQKEKEDIIKEADFSRQIEDMDAIANLESQYKTYMEKGKIKKAQATRLIINQLLSTKTLAPLKDIKNWPDYSKLNNKDAKKARQLLLKKVRNKLSSSTRYTFMPPELLHKQIRNRLPEGRKNLADAFLDILFEYIDRTSLKKCAIFVTHTFNRIIKFAMDEYDHEFLQQIIEIGEMRINHKTSPSPRIMKKGKKNATKTRISKKRK